VPVAVPPPPAVVPVAGSSSDDSSVEGLPPPVLTCENAGGLCVLAGSCNRPGEITMDGECPAGLTCCRTASSAGPSADAGQPGPIQACMAPRQQQIEALQRQIQELQREIEQCQTAP